VQHYFNEYNQGVDNPVTKSKNEHYVLHIFNDNSLKQPTIRLLM